MRLLPLTFKKRGFEFKQLDRTNKAAMYEQRLFGEVVGIEVFMIRVNAEATYGSVVIQAGESYPGDSAFGTTAWSIPVLDNYEKSFRRAWKRYEGLNA